MSWHETEVYTCILSPLPMVVLVPMVSIYDDSGQLRVGRGRDASALDTTRRNDAERPAMGERHLHSVHEGARAAKPLGSIWVFTSYPLVAAGPKMALGDRADVHVGERAPASGFDCIIFCVDNSEDGFGGDLSRMRELYREVPLLVFGPRLDLALAWVALQAGANGFLHAAMGSEQVAKAVGLAQKGELVAPRQLLEHVLARSKTPEIGDLSVRQREVLELVAEDLSNAEIAKRLYLSESTIKQHLRTAYKSLGVRNRTEAAKMIKNYGRNP